MNVRSGCGLLDAGVDFSGIDATDGELAARGGAGEHLGGRAESLVVHNPIKHLWIDVSKQARIFVSPGSEVLH